jgi:hypothetical protein
MRPRVASARSSGNPLVYFDIKLGRYGEGTPLGRIIIELKARSARLQRCSAGDATTLPASAAATLLLTQCHTATLLTH